MFVSTLQRIFVIALISFSALSVKAQQAHFVYLQTENGQPFYVRLNKKVISSSPAGYIILPNLNDGDYQLIVGFPKNEFPEEGFQVSVDKKNQGFLLKNFGEKGWGLFNMQSLALLSGSSSNTIAPPTAKKNQDDPFSKMLANVVKDSSILQNNEPVIAIKDSPSQKNENLAEAPVIKNAEPNPVIQPASPITKLLSENDKEGMQMVYVDKNDKKADTVRIFIPAEKIQNPQSEGKIAAVGNNISNQPAHTDTSQLTITPTVINPEPDTVTLINDTIRIYKEPVKKSISEENKDSSLVKNNEAKPEVTLIEPQPVLKTEKKPSAIKKDDEIIVLPKTVTSSKVNSDCKGFATDEDFLKLRKKMAADNNNDAMIRSAKKIFRAKCFSTEQIKNLSFLFLTDEGKYMFFDTAYPFASDSDQYHLLESQLTDEYYIKRFNAMIHK